MRPLVISFLAMLSQLMNFTEWLFESASSAERNATSRRPRRDGALLLKASGGGVAWAAVRVTGFCIFYCVDADESVMSLLLRRILGRKKKKGRENIKTSMDYS